MIINNTTSFATDTVMLSRASEGFSIAQVPEGNHMERTFMGQYSTSCENARRDTITVLTFTVPIYVIN
jgi:hypothetical protein